MPDRRIDRWSCRVWQFSTSSPTPALAARLLGAGAGALLQTPHPEGVPVVRYSTLLGALFESLATPSVRTSAEAAGARGSHLHAARGDHEIDLIVTRDDGRMLALEVKLAPIADDHDVRHLHGLRRQVGR